MYNAPNFSLTKEIIGGNAVIVPNLKHQNSRLAKLCLLQGENGLLLLIDHFFLQIEMGRGIHAKEHCHSVCVHAVHVYVRLCTSVGR